MATPFKFNTKEHGSINDSALKDLPLGKHDYEITKITYAPVKADQSGKRHQLVIELRHESGSSFTHFLEIAPKDKTENEATRARIASEEFNAFVQAAGFTGTLTAPKFKVLYNKTIGIETTKTKSKGNGKDYINIKQIVKGGWSDEEKSDYEGSDEPDADEEEEDEEEVAAKKKAAAAKKRKAAAAAKKKKKAAEEEEEEDEEDEEDDDSDEEEEDSDDEDEDDDDPFA